MDTGAQGGTDTGDDSVGGGTGLTDSGQDTGATGSGTTDSYDSDGDERSTDTGRSSGGGSQTERVTSGVDAVTSGISNVVDNSIDAGQDAFRTVESNVNRVGDTLPGRTGEAFVAGATLAAVPEPTPVTEVSGAAIAGSAALVGGGVLASRALRNRDGSEVGVGERVRNELEIGQSRQDVSEVGVGGGVGSTTEVPPGRTGRMTSEVGLGSTTTVSELEVGEGDDQPTGPTINVAEQLGIGQQRGQQVGQQEEPFTIGRDTIEDVERTGELEEAERQRQIREELERRQEFVREDGTPGQINRDPVRFPADEAATGTAPGILEQVGSDFNPGRSDALATGVGAGATTPDFLGGDRVSDDVTGAGTDPASGAVTGIQNPYGDALGIGAQTEPTADTTTTTDTGGLTDSGTDTGTDTLTDTGSGVLTDTTTVEATTTAQGQAQAVTEATPQQFAQPEVTTFETQVTELNAPGTSLGQGSRRRPRRDEPDPENDEEANLLAFDTDTDAFGSGILSGSDAVDSLFDR